MSKYYGLLINEHDAVVAVAKSKKLLRLFIVQRHLEDRNPIIVKIPKKLMNNSSVLLSYYFGHAITEFERRFVDNYTAEYGSEIEMHIGELRVILNNYRSEMSKKEKKYIKKLINRLEKIDLSNDKKFAKRMMETIYYNGGGEVYEYLENLELFNQCMNHGHLR